VVPKGLINAINYVNIMNIHTFKNSHFSLAVRDNKCLVCVCVCVCVCYDMYTHTQTKHFHILSVIFRERCSFLYTNLVGTRTQRIHTRVKIHKPGKCETGAALACINNAGQF
jgi:hypothetical protein